MNLESVLPEEIRVTVGGVVCDVSVSTERDEVFFYTIAQCTAHNYVRMCVIFYLSMCANDIYVRMQC